MYRRSKLKQADDTQIASSCKNIVSQVLTYTNKENIATPDDEEDIIQKLISNALRDLKDPMVPIRAHGIDQLSKIITVRYIHACII